MTNPEPSDNPSPIRILVADDEAGLRDSYRDILQPPGGETYSAGFNEMRSRLFGPKKEKPSHESFDLTLCGGAEEAVHAVRDAVAAGRPYNVVFLDMRMPPGRDGVWAAIQIRTLDRRVDIVVVTAYSDIDPEDIAKKVPPTNSLFYLQKPFHAHEIRQLAGALGRRRQAEDRIHRLAYYDGITGLPNRVYFKEKLAEAVDAARRKAHPMALFFLDLDNFKRINDTLGHSYGDLLLNEVTKRLVTNLRTNDIIDKSQSVTMNLSDRLARLGGDEFTLLLTRIQCSTDAETVARRLLKVFAEPISLVDHDVTITASIGIAIYPDNGRDVEELLKNADLAMYFAKRKGRNNYQLFDENMNAAALKRLTIETHLRAALQKDELSVHYQPQIDIRTGEVTGMEALLRWNNAELGQVSPMEFIPIAEESGLIVPIGEWVLRSACSQANTWRKMGMRFQRVSVNVSVHQFIETGFAAQVDCILAETGLEPEALEIEITESVLMRDGESALQTLQELKALGISLAIDDFGTGYSNLSYLKQFPIDRLKIDRSFLSAVNANPQEQAIISAIIAMAESMQLYVTAEGVETEGQVNYLKTRNCDEAQGYYFSHPLSTREAADFLRKAKNAALSESDD